MSSVALAGYLLWRTFQHVELAVVAALLARTGPLLLLPLAGYIVTMTVDSLGWRLLLRGPFGGRVDPCAPALPALDAAAAFVAATGVPDPASYGAAFAVMKRAKEALWTAGGYTLLLRSCGSINQTSQLHQIARHGG